jgi:hypothetical protein
MKLELELSEAGILREPWLTKAGIAAHLGCSQKWIERRVKEGLPYSTVAGRPKFRASVVEPWLERNGHIAHHGDVANAEEGVYVEPATNKRGGTADTARPRT